MESDTGSSKDLTIDMVEFKTAVIDFSLKADGYHVSYRLIEGSSGRLTDTG